jgi:uncharacterized protein
MVAIIAAATSGCMALGDHTYVLTPLSGRVLIGGPTSVSVRGVTLTQLPRPPDVQGQWWAEPLDLMIGRVLAQNLTQRLPVSRVTFDPAPPFAPANVLVELSVAQFGTNQAGDVLVQAEAKVVGLRLLDRSAWRTITPASGSTQAMVTALSIALADFTDLIAALVIESWSG